MDAVPRMSLENSAGRTIKKSELCTGDGNIVFKLMDKRIFKKIHRINVTRKNIVCSTSMVTTPKEVMNIC